MSYCDLRKLLTLAEMSGSGFLRLAYKYRAWQPLLDGGYELGTVGNSMCYGHVTRLQFVTSSMESRASRYACDDISRCGSLYAWQSL